jgi:uncharacterized protein
MVFSTEITRVKKHKPSGVRRWLFDSFTKILVVILLFLTYIFHVEPNWYDVHQVNLTLPNLPAAFDGYRIVELVDLHIDNFRDTDRLQHIVRITTQQRPDLVVMAGDYITGAVSAPHEVISDDSITAKPYQTMPHLKILELLTQITAGKHPPTPEKYLPTLAAGLQHLHAPDGVVAVLGNHDRWDWNPKFMKILQDLGIKVLENDITQIQRGSERLQIAGVKDFLAKQADLQPILTKMGESKGAILLAHEPDFADLSAATGKFDLQLSGHSHGGQVYIPGLKRITPPLAAKYPAGEYQLNGMIQYTSRGVGIVTPRVRFNCRPEITVLTLRSPNRK